MFVGRNNQVTEIKSALGSQGFNLIEVTGEAGIGKTALIQHILEEASDKTLVAQHSCLRQQTDSVQERCPDLGALFSNFIRALQPEQQKQLITYRHLEYISSVCPDIISDIAESPPVQTISSNRQQLNEQCEILYEILYTFCRNSSREILFWLDDFQQCDEHSLAIMERFLPLLKEGELPMGLIFAYRSMDGIPFSASWKKIINEVGSKKMEIPPLSQEESQSVVGSEIDKNFVESNPELVLYLYEHSNGNPLYIKEFLRYSRKHGVIESKFGYWRVRSDYKTQFTNSIKALLTKRIEQQLHENNIARYLLYYLQVNKGPVSAALLKKFEPKYSDQINSALDALILDGVIQRDIESSLWSFSHPLWYEIEYPYLTETEKQNFLKALIKLLNDKDSQELLSKIQLTVQLSALDDSLPQLTALIKKAIDLNQESEDIHLLITLYELLVKYAETENEKLNARLNLLRLNTHVGNSRRSIKLAKQIPFHHLDKQVRKEYWNHTIHAIAAISSAKDVEKKVDKLLKDRHVTDQDRLSILFASTSGYDLRHAAFSMERLQTLASLESLFDAEQRITYEILNNYFTTLSDEDTAAAIRSLEKLYHSRSSEMTARQEYLCVSILSTITWESGEMDKALKYISRKQELMPEVGGELSGRQLEVEKAKIHLRAGRYEQSSEIWERIIPEFEMFNETQTVIEGYLYLGGTYMMMIKLNEAVNAWNKGLKLAEDSNAEALIPSFLMNLSSLYSNIYQYDKVLQLMDILHEKYRENLPEAQFAKVHHILLESRCTMYKRSKQLYSGLKNAEEILAFLDKQEGESKLINQMLTYRSRLYYNLGEKKLSYDDYVRAKESFILPDKLQSMPDIDITLGLAFPALFHRDSDYAKLLLDRLRELSHDYYQMRVAEVEALYYHKIEGDYPRACQSVLKGSILAVKKGWSSVQQFYRTRFPRFDIRKTVENITPENMLLWLHLLNKVYREQTPLWEFYSLKMAKPELETYFRKEIKRADKLFDNADDVKREEYEKMRLDLFPGDKKVTEPSISFQFFDRFELLVDGIPLPQSQWKTKLGKEVLAFLVLRGNRYNQFVSSQEITNSIWRDSPRDKALNSLMVLISRLRKMFMKIDDRTDWIEHSQDGYRFNSNVAAELDFNLFTKEMAKGKEAAINREKKTAVAHFEKAADLYKGPFLRDFNAKWNEELKSHFKIEFEEAIHFIANYYQEIKQHSLANHYVQLLQCRMD